MLWLKFSQVQTTVHLSQISCDDAGNLPNQELKGYLMSLLAAGPADQPDLPILKGSPLK